MKRESIVGRSSVGVGRAAGGGSMSCAVWWGAGEASYGAPECGWGETRVGCVAWCMCALGKCKTPLFAGSACGGVGGGHAERAGLTVSGARGLFFDVLGPLVFEMNDGPEDRCFPIGGNPNPPKCVPSKQVAVGEVRV